MFKRLVASLLLPFLFGYPDSRAEAACGRLAIEYSAPRLKPIETAIVLQRLDPSALAPYDDQDGAYRKSDQGTVAWTYVEQPSFNVEGPWTTHVQIRTLDDRRIAFALEIREHANQAVRLNWLNEKLLFVRIWWGRIVSTDLILDVDRGEWLYVEEANHGAAMAPCQADAD